MMNTTFTEIDAWEVKNSFPEFYHEAGRFFEIVHKEQPIGFVGVRPLLDKGCEMEVFIFSPYRNALTKGIVLSTLDFPKSLSFQRCWIITTRRTLVKLFNSMKKYSIFHRGLLKGKHVFVREFQ
jgi:hypothetical protein